MAIFDGDFGLLQLKLPSVFSHSKWGGHLGCFCFSSSHSFISDRNKITRKLINFFCILVFTYISLLTYIGNRGLGKIYCSLILATEVSKVLSTSRSSKLIWVKSKEVNQAQTALLQALPWFLIIRENTSRI